MNHLEELRKIKGEVENMKFSYENVHRMMHLVYISKEHLSSTAPIPNKEIAHHQVCRIANIDFEQIVKSSNKNELQKAYNELVDNFIVVLNYM